MTDCTLCTASSAPAGSSSLEIARNDAAIATLHDDLAVPGHAMIVARDHVQNVSDLEPSVRRQFFELFVETEAALLQALAVERVILVKLGLAVPHLHWHLYPMSAAATRADVFAALNTTTPQLDANAETDDLIASLRDLLRHEQ